MNRSIINVVKYNRFIYSLYYFVGSWLIKALIPFVKSNPQMIVFSSYGGRRFDDSPKAIFEELIKDSRFDGYDLVWAFVEPEKYVLPRGRKIRIDTFTYYKSLLKARVWITNSSMTRGLNFIGKNTFQLNTWHGSAIKKMGKDISDSSKSFRVKGRKDYTSVMLAQSQYDVDVFSRVFRISKDKFRIIGLPRNDELAKASDKQKSGLKEALGLPYDKKVILYAPTYREYEKDSSNNCVLVPPIDFVKWKQYLGDSFVVLFRAHYEVVRVMNIIENDFMKDVSSYPRLNDLMIASDILVSDYSSIFFDYAIMGKPMISFCYDYNRYEIERGMYFDIRNYLPYADNEDSLLELIKQTDFNNESMPTIKFRDAFVTEYGTASKKALDIIYNEIR